MVLVSNPLAMRSPAKGCSRKTIKIAVTWPDPALGAQTSAGWRDPPFYVSWVTGGWLSSCLHHMLPSSYCLCVHRILCVVAIWCTSVAMTPEGEMPIKMFHTNSQCSIVHQSDFFIYPALAFTNMLGEEKTYHSQAFRNPPRAELSLSWNFSSCLQILNNLR